MVISTSRTTTTQRKNSPSGSDFLSKENFLATRKRVEEATTLSPECYRLVDYHAEEMDRVFSEAWICVGFLQEVMRPGQMLRAVVGGQPIVITRNKQGELKGFYNVCRHRGSLLVLADGKYERFRCPYHSWTYDLDGKLQNCPLFSPAGDEKLFDKNDYHLLPVRVATYGCFVFVTLSERTEELIDYLGDMPEQYKNFPFEELILVKRKNYDIKANWKLVVENFLEYYHLPFVHPELCEVMPIEMHKRNQGSGMYLSFYASPLAQGGSALDKKQLRPMPNLSAEQEDSGYFPLIFPNLAMFLLPHHLLSLIMRPTAVDATEERVDLLVHPSLFNEHDCQKKIDDIFAFYDMVNLQDIQAVERVQHGIGAKAYKGGRLSFRFEEPVHRFQNMVIDFVTGERRSYVAD